MDQRAQVPVLTGDRLAGFDRGCNLGVELHLRLQLLDDVGFPFIHLRVHPVTERLADDDVADGGDVVSQELLDLTVDLEQNLSHLREPLGKIQDVHDRQPLVVGNSVRASVLLLDLRLLVVHHVAEVVQSDVVVGRKKEALTVDEVVVEL